MKKIVIVIALSITWLSATCLFARGKQEVTFEISNITDCTGNVLLSIGDGEFYGMAEADSDLVRISLSGIPDGTHKIYVFHDANGNWTLDKDEQGTPLENCAMEEINVSEDSCFFKIELQNIRNKRGEVK